MRNEFDWCPRLLPEIFLNIFCPLMSVIQKCGIFFVISVIKKFDEILEKGFLTSEIYIFQAIKKIIVFRHRAHHY